MESSKNQTTMKFLSTYKTMRWMGLTPFFKQTGDSRVTTNLKKYFSLILLLPYLLLIIYVIYGITKKMLEETKRTQNFITLLILLCDTFFVITSLLGAIFRKTAWKNLFCKLKYLESKMSIAKRQNLLLAYFCYYIMTFLLLLETIFRSHMSLCEGNILEFVSKNVSNLTIYWKIFLAFFFCHFTNVAFEKIETIKNILKNTFKKNYSKIKIYYSKQLTDIQELIIEIDATIKIMNEILSWPFFLVIIGAFFAMVSTLNSTISYASDGFHKESLDYIIQVILLMVSSTFY